MVFFAKSAEKKPEMTDFSPIFQKIWAEIAETRGKIAMCEAEINGIKATLTKINSRLNREQGTKAEELNTSLPLLGIGRPL